MTNRAGGLIYDLMDEFYPENQIQSWAQEIKEQWQLNIMYLEDMEKVAQAAEIEGEPVFKSESLEMDVDELTHQNKALDDIIEEQWQLNAPIPEDESTVAQATVITNEPTYKSESLEVGEDELSFQAKARYYHRRQGIHETLLIWEDGLYNAGAL
jgi:hypothetical protein